MTCTAYHRALLPQFSVSILFIHVVVRKVTLINHNRETNSSTASSVGVVCIDMHHILVIATTSNNISMEKQWGKKMVSRCREHSLELLRLNKYNILACMFEHPSMKFALSFRSLSCCELCTIRSLSLLHVVLRTGVARLCVTFEKDR